MDRRAGLRRARRDVARGEPHAREPLTVAACQPPCVARDVTANARAHADAVRAARAKLVVFPELSLTGYELDAEPLAPDDAALAPLVEACAATGSVALAGAPVALPAGGAAIGVLRIDRDGAAVAYRKTHLGREEARRFSGGDGAAAIDLDGLRVGLGVCKDTGTPEHVAAVAALGVDLYAAGLVHRPEELAEQERRGRGIARACGTYVAFASFAGATGGGYDRTAGASAIWAPDGSRLACAGAEPGELVRAVLA